LIRKLSDYTSDYEKTADIVFERFTERKWVGLGERQKVGPQMAKEIVEMSI